MPPSGDWAAAAHVSLDSGASAMLHCVGTMGVSKASKGALGTIDRGRGALEAELWRDDEHLRTHTLLCEPKEIGGAGSSWGWNARWA